MPKAKASEKTQKPTTTLAKLRRAVHSLTDQEKWHWGSTTNTDQVPVIALNILAELGLIKHFKHRYGGDIWQVGNTLYGRVDDLIPKELKAGIDSGKLKIGRANLT